MDLQSAFRFWQIWISHSEWHNHKEVDIVKFFTDEDYFDFICKNAEDWVNIYDKGDEFAKSTEFHAYVVADVFNFYNVPKRKRKTSDIARNYGRNNSNEIGKLDHVEL